MVTGLISGLESVPITRLTIHKKIRQTTFDYLQQNEHYF